MNEKDCFASIEVAKKCNSIRSSVNIKFATPVYPAYIYI